jgi:multidrug resistance protein, MATE family
MIPLGIGISLAIRIGTVLPNNSNQAKLIACFGFIMSEFTFIIMCICMYVFRYPIYHIFTNEPEVIAGCEEVWMKVCIYCFFLFTFAVNMGIATGLEKQWLLGVLTIFFLWVVALPGAYYFAIVRQGGLNAVWQTIWPPYVCINALLMASFITTDWEAIGHEIREREGYEHDDHWDSPFLTKHDNVETSRANHQDSHSPPQISRQQQDQQQSRSYGSIEKDKTNQ